MNPKTHRLAYIDWMRGLACVFMFEVHCYDAWLRPQARSGKFFWYSQFFGSLPAPLFLFLAGVSFAFVTERMRQKGIAAPRIASATILRGAQIFVLGLLFRLQEFLLGYPWAPRTDLLRVDILNMIGLSLMLIGVLCYLSTESAGLLPAGRTRSSKVGQDWRATLLRRWNEALALLVAAAIVLFTPPLWTTHQPRWLPWYLESYVNGVHTFANPQPWLFPVFPWAAFAFIGLAAGFLLVSPWAQSHEFAIVSFLGAGGAVLLVSMGAVSALARRFYAVYDFWHTSPDFFLGRVGVLFLLLPLSYAWCRWGWGRRGLRPLIELGQASLLVYWLHIEFVYGRFSILGKGAQSIPAATAGLAVICAAMVALAVMRNRVRGRGLRGLMFWSRVQPAAPPVVAGKGA